MERKIILQPLSNSFSNFPFLNISKPIATSTTNTLSTPPKSPPRKPTPPLPPTNIPKTLESPQSRLRQSQNLQHLVTVSISPRRNDPTERHSLDRDPPHVCTELGEARTSGLRAKKAPRGEFTGPSVHRASDRLSARDSSGRSCADSRPSSQTPGPGRRI